MAIVVNLWIDWIIYTSSFQQDLFIILNNYLNSLSAHQCVG